jgi:hypothetical protein
MLVAEAMNADPTRMTLFKQGFSEDYGSRTSLKRTFSTPRNQSEKNTMKLTDRS